MPDHKNILALSDNQAMLLNNMVGIADLWIRDQQFSAEMALVLSNLLLTMSLDEGADQRALLEMVNKLARDIAARSDGSLSTKNIRR